MKKKPVSSSNPPAPSEPTFTPAQYRDAFCLVKSRSPGGPSSVSVAFAVASRLFAWEQQAHHYGADSFKLTASDFEKALSSAMNYPCEAPFAGAVPTVIKDKFKAFKPKKSNPSKG